MFGRFIYGQCSLTEAFWKFSILGLLGYEIRFLQVLMHNISLLSMNAAAFAWLCFYIAAFLATITYSIVCIIGMWNTYKEYEKSKILAIICMLLVLVMIYFTVSQSIY